MPPLVASDLLQISMLGRWTNGHPVVNVLHFRVDAVAATVDVEAAVEDVVENWQSQIVPEFRDNYRFEGAAYMDLRSETGATGVIPPVTGQPTQGGSTGESSHPAASLLVHKRTSAARGSRQGRMYLPAPGDGDIDEDGRLTAACINAMTPRLAAFLANTTQEDIGLPTGDQATRYLVVLHKDGTSSRVTSLQVDSLVGTQRRRHR